MQPDRHPRAIANHLLNEGIHLGTVFFRRLLGLRTPQAMLVLICMLGAQPALAAIVWTVNIDADNDPATGCDLTLGTTPFNGVEMQVITTVDAGMVTDVSYRECTDPATDSFGSLTQISPGGWSVGTALGDSGADVIESFLPLNLLQGPAELTVRLAYEVRDSLTSGQDVIVTSNGSGSPLEIVIPAAIAFSPVPALPVWASLLFAMFLAVLAIRMIRKHPGSLAVLMVGLVFLSAGIGVVWAAITPDGNVDDWVGIPPIGSDPLDPDAPDLVSAYATVMDNQLGLRLDVRLSSDPQAVDDDPAGVAAYVTTLNTPLNVADDANDPVERNDNSGFPVAVIESFGGADAGGAVTTNAAGSTLTPLPQGSGSLTVNANGSFDFVPPNGFTGNYQFLYRLLNSEGKMSDATVTLAVNQAPVAADDDYRTGPNTPISRVAGDADDLLDNDQLAFPVATLVSFGGGSLPGDSSTNAAGSTVNIGADGGLTVNADGSFSFTPETGSNATLSFQYLLQSAAGSDTATVTIDINEAPTITSGSGASAAVNVAENQTAVTDVNSSDPDGEVEGSGLTYSLTGGDDIGEFSIVPGTGVLTFSSAPDFEHPGDADMNNIYLVQVTVTDAGGLTDVQDISVTVTDVVENTAPEITSDGGGDTASVNAPENQTAATDIQSTDDLDTEGSGLAYSFTTVGGGGIDNGLFDLAADGTLSFKVAPNFEAAADNDGMNDYEVQVTVTDSGMLTDLQDITVNVTNVNEAPMIGTDPIAYATAGCTQLRAGGAVSPAFAFVTDADAIHTASKANISDPDTAVPGGLTFSLSSAAANGTATVNANGSFIYVPNAGFTGVDSFAYQVTDGATPVTGTINVTVSEMVRYVHAASGGTSGGGATGCSDLPFDNFTDVEATSAAGDTIFVFRAGGATLDDGITLLNGQKLHGEGVGLSVTGFGALVAAGDEPLINHSAGNAVEVDATAADRLSIEIRGLNLQGSDNAIDVTSGAAANVGITIDSVTVSGAGNEGIDLNSGASGTFNATVTNNTLAAVGNALDVITSGAGNLLLDFSGNTEITSGGAGIYVEDVAGTGSLFITGFADNAVSGANVGDGARILGAVFDSDPTDADFDLVDAGTMSIGVVSDRVGGAGLILGTPTSAATRVSGNLSFDSVKLYTFGGAALSASGSGFSSGGTPPTSGFQLAVTNSSMDAVADAINGPAVALDPLTGDVELNNLSSSMSPVAGVLLDTIEGSFVAKMGGIATAAGAGFQIVGGTVDATYGGSIVQSTNAPLVAVSGGHTGIATFNTGSLSASAGTGLQFDNADGTYNFNGTNTLNGGDAGIDILNGSAGSFSFSTSTSITSPTGAAFNLQGGTAAVVYRGGITQANNADLVSVSGGHGTGTVTFQTGTLLATNGDGLQFDTVNGTYNFNGTNTSNGGSGGIGIVNSNATFSIPAIDITGSGSAGIDIDNTAGSVTIGTATVNGGGSMIKGVDLSNSTASFDFTSLTVSNTTGAGLALTNVDGPVTVSNAGSSITTTGGAAIDIDQGFGSVTYNGSINNTAGRSVEITNHEGSGSASTVNLTGNITDSAIGIFLDNNDQGAGTIVNLTGTLNLSTTASTAFSAINGGTVNVTDPVNSNIVTTTTGTAIVITDSDIGASGVKFSTINVGPNALRGILLTNAGSGAFTATGGTIQSVTDRGVDVFGGNGDVNVGSSISTTSTGRSLEVTGHTGGTVTISGSIDDNGLGINLASNTGGTITISGAMDVDTVGANTGFNASGGGTVNVAGANHNIDTSAGTGIGVNITSTVIGASGVAFRSVSSNGAPNGIILNATGTSGTFSVTGDGMTDASGGTIRNSTGPGVSLTSVSDVSLAYVDIDSGADSGIQGSGVTDLTLTGVDITGNGNAVDEHGIELMNLFGTSVFANMTVSGSAEHNVEIINDTGTLTSLNVSNSQFLDNSAGLGADGFLMELRNSAIATLTVSGSTFDGNRSDHIQINPIDSSTANVTVGSSVFTNDPAANTPRAVNMSTSTTSDLTFDINGNQFTGPATNGSAAVRLTTASTTASSSVLKGQVRNNSTMDDWGFGVSMDSRGDGVMTVLIDNNAMANIRSAGVDGISGDAAGDAGDIDLTITNNDIGVLAGGFEAIAWLADRATSVCANIRTNTLAAAGSDEVFLDGFSTSSVEGFDLESAATDCGGGVCADADAHLAAVNTLSTVFTDTVDLVAPGTCLTP